MNINVLITSVSGKVPLVNAVREASRKISSKSKVIGGDINEHCIARHFVDVFWKMPSLSELNINDILRFCQKNNIRFIIPTRNGELEFWAEKKRALEHHQIYVMVSDKEPINLCLDKLLFSEYLAKHSIGVIPSYERIDAIDSEFYVVKDRYGAGSKKVGLKLRKEEAISYARSLENPIFQPYIDGKEYSVDIYMGKNGKVIGAVARTRDVVVNGESQITTTCKHSKLEEICTRTAETIGLFGHVMFQAFVDDSEKVNIIECNPRFGGASTTSITVGLDSFYWFFLESLGRVEDICFMRSEVEKRQIRYTCDKVENIRL